MSFRRFLSHFCLLATLAPAFVCAKSINGSSLYGLRYGPNLSWQLMGNTPIVWGEWLPQAAGSLNYAWLEPLRELEYGEELGRSATYLFMDASAEVSPFYVGYSMGLGLRPFRFVEIGFEYQSSLYLLSNIEMVTVDEEGKGRIAETWNADYISDNVWVSETAEFDYSQLFDFYLTMNCAFSGGIDLGFTLHYILSDVSTNFDGKSYDYRLNIPVFSRDFFVVLETFGRVPLTNHFALVFESAYYKTGYLRNHNTIEKESLGYGKALLGAHFFWNEKRQNLTAKFGGWKRVKNEHYDGSLAQQFLVQLEYQGYFSFPFHKNFLE